MSLERLLEAGVESLRAGRVADASAAFREVLRAAPGHPDAHYLMAQAALAGGALEEAEAHAARAIEGDPRHVDARVLAGNLAQRGGRPALAERRYREALGLEPGYAEAWLNLANVLGEQDRTGEALDAYAKALQLQPRLLAATLNRSALLARLGRTGEARAELARAEAAHPASSELPYRRATLEEGDPAAALVLLERVLRLDPRHREAQLRRGRLLSRLGRHAEALEALGALRSQHPGWLEAQLAYGDAGALAQRTDAALAGFDAALALEPAHFGARVNRALLAGRREAEGAAALAQLRALLDEAPGNARVLNGIGVQLRRLGRLREAIACCEAALERAPGLMPAVNNLARAHLELGEFGPGWRHYGELLRGRLLPRFGRRFEAPLWRGEPLEGRTLLVWAEQGIGDQVMYAGQYADLAARGARLVLECAPRLAGLFARSFPDAEIVTHDAAGADRLAALRPDFHAPMSGLCEYLRPSWEAFPRHRGYLRADPARRAAWRTRLDALGPGLKVGISWRGGTESTGAAARSTAPADWRPLLAVPGARFVNLQYGDCDRDLAALRAGGAEVAHWPGAADDVEEATALACELDLVVSVCTTAIHLAGAVGREVWVLVPARPGWRYLLEGEALPWYPSARMLRQAQPGDWAPVIARAARELSARTARA